MQSMPTQQPIPANFIPGILRLYLRHGLLHSQRLPGIAALT
jgi:hypothetical protein